VNIVARQWDHWVMQTARHYGDLSSIILETGFESIDDDHRKMIGQALEINRLMEDLDHHNFNLEIVYQLGELCNRLRQTTQEHFEREEGIMQDLQLSGRTGHTEAHQLILKRLDDMIADLSEGKLTVTFNLKRAILDWVVVHINEEDASTFTPHNLLPVLELSDPPKDLSGIFPKCSIPVLDSLHGIVHRFCTGLSVEQSDLNTCHDAFVQCCELEDHLLENFPINTNPKHEKVHVKLGKLWAKVISATELPERLALLKQWRNLWFLHHHDFHVKDFSVIRWSIPIFEKVKKPLQLQALIPDLGLEELDQGRFFSHRLLIKFYQQFSQLESDDSNKDIADALRKSMKKLRGHVKFQHEVEEEELKDQLREAIGQSKDPEDWITLRHPSWEEHQQEHIKWIGLLDYFKVLIDSDQFELAHTVCKKLISQWFSHELFYNRRLVLEKPYDA
jgi:hemerythrin-like metal-binding protein